jgi:hypothetical protein
VRTKLPAESVKLLLENILLGQVPGGGTWRAIKTIWTVVKMGRFINLLLQKPDTVMMLCFGEDGAANSSGADTVFRANEADWPGLAPSHSDFHFVDTDHLGLGADKGGVGAIARALLDGKSVAD